MPRISQFTPTVKVADRRAVAAFISRNMLTEKIVDEVGKVTGYHQTTLGASDRVTSRRPVDTYRAARREAGKALYRQQKRVPVFSNGLNAAQRVDQTLRDVLARQAATDSEEQQRLLRATVETALADVVPGPLPAPTDVKPKRVRTKAAPETASALTEPGRVVRRARRTLPREASAPPTVVVPAVAPKPKRVRAKKTEG